MMHPALYKNDQHYDPSNDPKKPLAGLNASVFKV